ncbi:MAG TPA: hypothetical protein VMW47_03395 [Verrucomicrobiae bacterium]|nr:hypothetical protein [Verrucomicrobiae bacterium]
MWFWHRLAVDVPFEDDWSSVSLLRRVDAGRLTLGALWAQHNENRMLLPRLILLALARPTRADTRWEMLLGIGLLLIAAAILARLAVRPPRRSWWWAVPPVAALCSWVQAENLLWGFQFPWYMILAALLGICWLLGRDPVPWGAWTGAGALALAASFSSLQGLFLWPCGLLLLMGRGSGRAQRRAWLGLGALATLVYFAGYRTVSDGHSGVLAQNDPVGAVRYLLEAVGSVVVGPMGPTQLLGAGILLAALGVGVGWLRSDWRDPDLLVPMALMGFAALFDLALVEGRLGLGVAQAASSRYTSYDLLWLVGVWLGLVALGGRHRWGRGGWRGRSLQLAAAVGCGALLIQVGLAYPSGWAAGRSIALRRLEAVEIVAAYPAVSRPLVRAYLYPAPRLLRSDIRFLRERHLGLFAGRGPDRATGVVPGGIPGRLLPLPPTLARLVAQTDRAQAAWSVLSTLVDKLAWVRRRFVAVPTGYPVRLLRWATGPGLGHREVALYLAPVRRELDRLLSALVR